MPPFQIENDLREIHLSFLSQSIMRPIEVFKAQKQTIQRFLNLLDHHRQEYNFSHWGWYFFSSAYQLVRLRGTGIFFKKTLQFLEFRATETNSYYWKQILKGQPVIIKTLVHQNNLIKSLMPEEVFLDVKQLIIVPLNSILPPNIFIFGRTYDTTDLGFGQLFHFVQTMKQLWSVSNQGI